MRYSYLSNVSAEWAAVAEQHHRMEEKVKAVYDLPIEEFRKIPYTPPALAADAPVIGPDLYIDQILIPTRDGGRIGSRIYRPVNVTQGHLAFFNVHGGGWTVGTPETEESQNRMVAVENNGIVVSVDYRKAPEHPFPCALHDAIDAFKWMIENANTLGIDRSRIVVGGGSAGANIIAALTQVLRDENIKGVIGQVLNIPVTCHPDHFPSDQHECNSLSQNANAPIVGAKLMRQFWHNYLPDASGNPLASPLLGKSLHNLPPAFQVAGMDPLRDEGIAYANALRADGADVTLKLYPGLPHAFYCYPELPSSKIYLRSVVDWIKSLQI